MPVLSISVVPVGTGSTSVSSYVAQCQEELARFPSVKCQLTPMATILEGSLEDCLAAAAALHGVPFDRGAKRVLTTIVIDDRRDAPVTMEGKIASVRRKLAR